MLLCAVAELRTVSDVDSDFGMLASLMTSKSFRAWWNESMADGFEQGQVFQARETLRRFFLARRDFLAPHAVAAIERCDDLAILIRWQDRAFAGESAAEIFGLAPG
jgi:hypothetical protein